MRALAMVSAALVVYHSLQGGALLTQAPTPPCSDPAQVVQAQVAAYNTHDLDAFAATYSPDIEAWFLPADTVIISGMAQFRQSYDFLREVPPEFGVDIVDRIVTGCFVVDHERLRAAGSQPAQDAGLAVYQVEGRLIRRIWFAAP